MLSSSVSLQGLGVHSDSRELLEERPSWELPVSRGAEQGPEKSQLSSESHGKVSVPLGPASPTHRLEPGCWGVVHLPRGGSVRLGEPNLLLPPCSAGLAMPPSSVASLSLFPYPPVIPGLGPVPEITNVLLRPSTHCHGISCPQTLPALWMET